MKGQLAGISLLLLIATLSGGGCGQPKQAVTVQTGQPVQAAATTPEQQTPTPAPQLVPNKAFRSAAYPGLPGEATATEAEMQALLQQAETYFNAQSLDAILAKGGNGAAGEMAPLFSDLNLASVYRSVKPNAPDEVPILALAIGQGVNTLNAHGLLWYEKGQWKSQPYPQVPSEWQKVRADLFQKANIGYGSFAELHQAGNRLAVVYSYSGTRMAEEVHLLQRENGVWRILWLPSTDNWLELLNTHIVFHDGIDSFTASHRDEQHPDVQWQEEWHLQGDRYVRVSTTKST